MSRDFPESDWKILRQVHAAALERYCHDVLAEVARLAADDTRPASDRFDALYGLVRDRNKQLSSAFDDMRRSMGFLRLLQIRSLGYVSDADLDRFSPHTRDSVRSLEQRPD